MSQCCSLNGGKKKKKKKKSELSLEKNLEEERVDTQKMEKKLQKSLSLSLSLSHTHTHTTHMQSFTCSHFFVQEKGKNIKSFRDIQKQQGQRQKRIWESALLIIWLTSSSVWYWKKERKKVLTWDAILLLAQKRIFSAIIHSFSQKQKNKDLKKRNTFCPASKQEISINLFSTFLSARKKSWVHVQK